jgi:hypothetical protein
MRTTIDLPEDTLRQLKARAALDGLPMKELVRAYVDKGLAQGPLQRSAQVRSPLPTVVVGKPLTIKQPTNAKLMALLDKQDAERAIKLLRRTKQKP